MKHRLFVTLTVRVAIITEHMPFVAVFFFDVVPSVFHVATALVPGSHIKATHISVSSPNLNIFNDYKLLRAIKIYLIVLCILINCDD